VRIAIDARAAAEVPAGRGRHVRELLRHLAALDADHEYVLLAREPWDDPALDGRFRWRRVAGPDPAWVLPGAAAARGADVLLATTSYLLAALSPVPPVAVVYDLVAFDPAFGAPRGSLFERATLPLAIRRARALLCISEATRTALVDRFPAAARTASAVPLAADARFDGSGAEEARRKLALDRPYVLITGTLEPRKNLPRLIAAFAALPPDLRDRYELVLAGPRGWDLADTDASIARHRELVRTLGYVDEADLPGLYAGAELFCYPSLQEGFGLPILEAMGSGTAVLTSDVSSMPEVAGDAACLVDPLDTEAIRAALEELLRDDALRADLARRGRERAARFSWERTARETLAALEAACRR
jgi:alpha-1,3-rhamnosyl/mannosyltransferase